MENPLLNPDQWVKQYADALYGYTLRRINDEVMAEDIVQETFLSAWRARDSFRGASSEKSWLFAICKNKIIDHYRKKAIDIMQPINVTDPSDNYFDPSEHWTDENKPGDWGMDYGHPMDNKAFYQVLDHCRKKLQQLQQSVFVMKYLEDQDAADICKVLGISSSNYWVLIHRAKMHLRACLEKNWIN